MLKKTLMLVGLLGVSACSTVTIHPGSDLKLATAPTHEERKNFFLWGLVGEHRVDVQQVCGQQSVEQMQSQATFVDGLLGAVTLGIYAPHSVKVWCE